MSGKGRGPEKGRCLRRFRDGYEQINWRRPSAPPTHRHPDRKKQASREACRQKESHEN